MNSSRIWAVLVGATVALVWSATRAGALVLLSDHFDSEPAYSNAAHVDASGDYDPQNWAVLEDGATPLGGGLTGTKEHRLQVTTYESAVNNNNPGAHSGDGYVRLVREHPHTNVNMRYGVGGQGTTTPAYMKLHLYGSSDGGGWNGGACGIALGMNNGGPSMFVGLSDLGYQNWDYDHPDTGWTDTGGDLIRNGWYEAGIQINSYKVGATNGTFDFWYNGAKVASDLPHTATSAGSWVINTGGGIEFYVDDVQIGMGLILIPEPGTLAALLIASAAAMIRRRR